MSQAGLTKVFGAELGQSSVLSQLSRHKQCQASALVEVVAVTSLELEQSQQEFLLGTSLSLPVNMKFSAGQISACQSLPLKAELTEPTFSSSLTSAVGSGCASLEVTSGLKVSSSKVTVSWSYPALSGELVTLTDSKYVATYEELRPVWPALGETTVAVETEREVEWRGGPQPWPLLPSSHYSELATSDQSVLTTTRLSSAAGLVWTVRCLTAGEAELTLTVGNRPSPSLPAPVAARSSVRVSCAVPHTLSLSPAIPGPGTPSLPPCPVQARQGRLAAQSYLDLRLEVAMKDSAGRNIDSLRGVKVDWAVSDQNLASVVEVGGVLQDRQNDAHQVLKVKEKTGPVDVTATIARQGGLLGSSTHSDTARLLLVEDALLSPSSLHLFVLEAGSAVASQGSGYFTVTKESGAVSASYSSGNSSLSVSPVTTGLSSLHLVDLCLSARSQARLEVSVAGVDRLLLEVEDKVQQGETITATVKMMEGSGRSLPLSALHHVEVGLQSDLNLVVVEGGEGAVFRVTGNSLGQVQLTASVSYSGRQVSSLPQAVTVFPPVVLEPRNISLVIGAAFQFTHTGGPADCSLQFSVEDPGLASTNQEGLVTSLALGTTSLTVTAVDREGRVFSQDSVRVVVRALTALQIVSPTSMVLAGTRLPLYLFGQDQEMNVFSYGSALPLLNIDWSVSPGPGPSLASPLASLGHALVSDNSGVVVFTSSSPGKFTVKATVTITSRLEEPGQFQVDRDKSLTVSTTLTVLESLRITNLEEEATAGGLLLAPDSKFQLRSNKNAVFSVQDSALLSVSQSGLVRTGSKSGCSLVRARTEQEEVAVMVEVRPVHYLLLEAESDRRDRWRGQELEQVPRGGKLELVVSRHDKYGRQFSETAGWPAEQPGLRPSRFDLMKLTSQTAVTVSRGWTVVRLEDKQTGQEAWLNLRLGDSLAGPSSLTVGDVTEFETAVMAEGRWETDNPAVLSIHSQTGLVVARQAGSATVKFVTTSGASEFSRQVSVGRAEVVSVETSKVVSGEEGGVSVVRLVLGQGATNNLRPEGKVSVAQLSLEPPPLSCEASWELEPSLQSVFSVSAQWSGQGWSCVFSRSPSSPAPLTPATISLTVLDTRHSLTYLPPLSVAQTSLEVGEAGAVIRVSGHPTVLDLLQTRHSEGLQLGSAWVEGEELHLPVSLTAPHYPAPPSVTLSVPATGQSLTVSLLPLISPCGLQTPGFLSALAGNLVSYYQTVLSIIAAALLAGYLTKTQLARQVSPDVSAPVPASPPSTAKLSPEKTGDSSQNPSSPYLWTVDNNPIYGSPIYR